MVLISDIIYCIYVGFAAITFLFLLKHLFKREKNQGLVNDNVYAYCHIPLLLRVLQIK